MNNATKSNYLQPYNCDRKPPTRGARIGPNNMGPKNEPIAPPLSSGGNTSDMIPTIGFVSKKKEIMI